MKNNHDRPTILEQLEQRQLMAAVTYEVIRGALHVIGTNRDDVIVLRAGSKLFSGKFADIRKVVVEGRGGNDLIRVDFSAKTLVRFSILAGAGNDTVYASAAPDNISGGLGDDSLFGAAGNDTILGGDGADTIDAQAGNDFVDGQLGNDLLTSESANRSDTLHGGPGDDQMQGSGVLFGEGGNDNIAFVATYFSGGVSVFGGDGNDQIHGLAAVGDPALYGAHLEGGSGNDTITGEFSYDEILGGAGDDQVNGDEPDQVNGGDGNDTITGGNVGGDDGDDVIWYFGHVVWGGAGNDYIHVMPGYGDGFDDLYGQEGNDTIIGGSGNGWFYGGPGDDYIESTGTSAYLLGEDGNDVLVGGHIGG